MKNLIQFVRKTSIIELSLFAGIACLALTAGYASLNTVNAVSYNDITGSARPIKVVPLANMQPMPDMIPEDKR